MIDRAVFLYLLLVIDDDNELALQLGNKAFAPSWVSLSLQIWEGSETVFCCSLQEEAAYAYSLVSEWSRVDCNAFVNWEVKNHVPGGAVGISPHAL